jgi:hypothetical protein
MRSFRYDHHARANARAVDAGFAERMGADPHRPAFRLYEIQNGNLIESYKNAFPQLEYVLFHAQRAFDLIVSHVENGAELPQISACPAADRLATSPSQPGHCETSSCRDDSPLAPRRRIRSVTRR